MKLLAYTNEKLEDLYKTGVYQITNKISDKVYIGGASRHTAPSSSGNGFYYRWGIHIRELNRNVHGNRHLQSAWNKYGEDAFEFSILEFVEPEKVDEVEQTYIDSVEKEKRYNICGKAGSPLGVKRTEAFKDVYAKDFKIFNPQGIEISGRNMTQFCLENNLSRANFQTVISGKALHTEGWTANLEAHKLWLEAHTKRGISKVPKQDTYRIRYREEGKNKVKYERTLEEAIKFRSKLEEKGYRFKLSICNWKQRINAKENG